MLGLSLRVTDLKAKARDKNIVRGARVRIPVMTTRTLRSCLALCAVLFFGEPQRWEAFACS
jgi:hypothetical protein